MNDIKIPMLDLRPEIEEQWDDLMAAVERVLRSGRFILGPEVEAFEHEVAEYLGVKHAVGVNSGTDALVIGLRALGIGPGDEVITTPFTFFATPESISNVGATPVFVDIDPRTFNIDPALIEAAITARTKAILPVHLFGHANNMAVLSDLAGRHGLFVIEDAAQAMGSTDDSRMAGSLGDVAAFSFFPSKNLGGLGDGGLVATNDDAVATAARMLRSHGSKTKYANETIGYNSRLDEIQAAVLRVRLEHLEAGLAWRLQIAGRYDEALSNVPGIITPLRPRRGRHTFHQYTIRVQGGRREEARSALASSGIASAIYYPVPCHRLPPYSGLADSVLSEADAAASEVLSLPLPRDQDAELLDRVREALGALPHGEGVGGVHLSRSPSSMEA